MEQIDFCKFDATEHAYIKAMVRSDSAPCGITDKSGRRWLLTKYHIKGYALLTRGHYKVTVGESNLDTCLSA